MIVGAQVLGCDDEQRLCFEMVIKNNATVLRLSHPLYHLKDDPTIKKLFDPIRVQLSTEQELQEQQSHCCEGTKEAVASGWSMLIAETHKQQAYIENMQHAIDAIHSLSTDVGRVALNQQEYWYIDNMNFGQNKKEITDLQEQIQALNQRMQVYVDDQIDAQDLCSDDKQEGCVMEIKPLCGNDEVGYFRGAIVTWRHFERLPFAEVLKSSGENLKLCQFLLKNNLPIQRCQKYVADELRQLFDIQAVQEKLHQQQKELRVQKTLCRLKNAEAVVNSWQRLMQAIQQQNMWIEGMQRVVDEVMKMLESLRDSADKDDRLLIKYNWHFRAKQQEMTELQKQIKLLAHTISENEIRE